jgi:iron complex transport system substrate-binding protein
MVSPPVTVAVGMTLASVQHKEDLVRKSILMALLLLLVAASSVLVACGEEPSPSTLTDDGKREVTVPGNPQRIVSLGSPITEILFALDLGDRVVATDDYSDYPDEAAALAKVGAPWPGFNTETILDQDPDLILSSAGNIVTQLEPYGVPVFVVQPTNIEGVFEDILEIGDITGKEKEARALVDSLQARVDAVTARTGGLATDGRPTVFYEVDATDAARPYTAGSGTFQDELIGLAGGRNIADDASGWYQISVEKIVDADPDMIVLEDYQYGVSVESVGARSAAWAGLSAVKGGKAYPIEDPDLTSRYGPRIVDGLEALAGMIHPELFPEEDQASQLK